MENNNGENFKDSISEYYDATLKDLQDIELLQSQGPGQIALMLGYFLEFIATNQAIELLQGRIAQRNSDFLSGNYISEDNEKTKFGLEEEDFKNKGVDADKTELMAAYFELLGQTILTYVDGIKLQRFSKHTEDKDYLLAKTANADIYAGALFGLISFILNLQGVSLLYDISNQDYLDD